MTDTRAPGRKTVQSAPVNDPLSGIIAPVSGVDGKVASPEGLPFNVKAAPGPDIGFGEAAGAGFTAEKIETDRWFLTSRTEDEYRWNAYEVAREAGVRIPDAPGTDVSFSEWREMSRSERSAAGLPVSEIGGQWRYRGRNNNDRRSMLISAQSGMMRRRLWGWRPKLCAADTFLNFLGGWVLPPQMRSMGL